MKRLTYRLAPLAVWVSVALTLPAQAGMTVYGLRDVYRLRMQDVSFFILLLLVCAAMFRLLWNHAFKGFQLVPRLGYHQALGLSVLLGLAMLVVLTMISGIREVLSPGVWRRQGTAYRLNDPAQEPARRRSLEQLRAALFEYARSRGGQFPPHDFVPEIPDKLWESPDQNGTHYLYTGGLSTNDTGALLAIEGPAFGEARLVLTAGGQIEKLSSDEINRRRQPQPAK